jgi:Holliday junction resolvasome RuvABC endonuclease subunit
MNILALDIGICTGYAIYSIHGAGIRNTTTILSGVKTFEFKRGDSPDIRFLKFQRWVKYVVKTYDIKFIIYEKPFLRGGAASDFLKGFMLIIRMVAVECGASYKGIMGTTLKKYATGNGRASKEDMVLTASQRYGKVKDDNQADALHLLAYARENYDVDTAPTGDKEVSEKAST